MSTSNSTGFGRVVPFALVALALLGLASTGAFGGFAPALAFAALVFAALALALYRRHPAGVRVGLMVGIAVGAALIPQFLLFVWEATKVRDNAIALAVSAAIGVLALLPASMIVTSASALRRLPPSIPSWLAALALLIGATALLFALLKIGAGLAAPNALDGIEVHKLSFSPDGHELTAASEYASNENVFSIPEGRFVRTEKASGIRHFRKERPPYRSDDGALALEVAYAGNAVDSLAVRDAAGKTLWTRRLGWQDKLARGNACCLVGAAAFSPDNALVAIAYFGSVYLYEIRSGAEIVVMQGPTRKRTESVFWWWDILGHLPRRG